MRPFKSGIYHKVVTKFEGCKTCLHFDRYRYRSECQNCKHLKPEFIKK